MKHEGSCNVERIVCKRFREEEEGEIWRQSDLKEFRVKLREKWTDRPKTKRLADFRPSVNLSLCPFCLLEFLLFKTVLLYNPD